MSLELKPHLKEVDELYKKICEFESKVHLKHSYNPLQGAGHYVKEDIEAIAEALSDGLDFTPGDLDEIKDAMYSGRIDFMRLINDREALQEDEFQLLYIIGRPFFKSMRNNMSMDNMFWRDGRCTACSATPSLSVIEKESQRKYFCSFCGCQGYYNRIGCPGCLTENPRDITIITLDGEEGMRADTCEKCGSYFKTYESSMMIDNSPDSLDILSIPLDIVVQEKGFRRQSPNPVGILKIV